MATVPDVASADGVGIAYYDFGGTGPDLLMVHATGFHARVWQPVADRLQDDFHCWALDLRGHGDSGVRPDLDFTWSGFAEDVEAVLGALHLDRPRAVGHSLGGATLLMVEERHPGTFDSLYVYEPAIFVPSLAPVDDGSFSVQLALRRRPTFPSRAEAIANYSGKPPMDTFSDEVLAAYVDFGFDEAPDGSLSLKCRPEYEAGTFAGYAASEVFVHLDEVGCPVVLAFGSKTHDGEGGRNGLFQSKLAHARPEELVGLNHFGPQQDPSALADSIRSSLGHPSA